MTVTTPASTIAVIGRETFHTWDETLRRILDQTRPPRRVVVVDGGSPPRVQQRLLELAVAHDLTLIRGDAVIAANESRNLAMQHVDTEFVVFVDNDTLVVVGWLDGLERCARETGASVVSPAVLWGPTGCEEVHFAGGICHISDNNGVRRLEAANPRMHQAPGSIASLSRERTELTELHCVLVRTDAIRDLGLFDEALLAAYDEHDLALRIAQAGRATWLEPGVVVGYPFPKRLHASDLPFFLPRWSDAWSQRSFDEFNATWNISDTSTDERFRAGHKGRRVGRWPGDAPGCRGWVKKARWKARRAADLVATPVAVRMQDRRRARASPARVVHRASWDSTP